MYVGDVFFDANNCRYLIITHYGCLPHSFYCDIAEYYPDADDFFVTSTRLFYDRELMNMEKVCNEK